MSVFGYKRLHAKSNQCIHTKKFSPARGPAGLRVTDEQITQVNKRLAMPSSFALVFSQPGIT